MRLYKIIENENIPFEKILIPSNSGYKGMTPDPLHELGIPDKPGDSFTLETPEIPKMEVKRSRAEDIPHICDDYTSKGVPVLGLTGDDVYDEYVRRNPQNQLRVVDTIDWLVEEVDGKLPKYSRPTLCLIGVEGSEYGKFPSQSTVAVDGKFEYLARDFLQRVENDFGVKFNVSIQSGKIENAIPDLAAYGIDIVFTGNTLRYSDKDAQTPRAPPLTVLKSIRQSDISVITSWPRPGTTNVLKTQYANIQARLKNPTDSLTSELLQDPNKLRKKFGEEIAELLAAHTGESEDRVLGEIQDVLYTVQMMAVQQGVTWEQVLEKIEKAQ